MSKVFKAVGNAVSSVVKAVVNVVSSVVKAVVNVVASVVNFVAQPFMGLLGGMPDMPSATAEVARQQGVLLQREGSDQQIPVVYGYRKVGGIVTFAETGADNNKYLYVVYVFSEGVVEGLREVFIDDWQLPVALTANLNAGQIVNVNTDRYKDRVQMVWNPGVYYTNPSASPVGAYIKNNLFGAAPSFTNQMNFNGLAALAVRYEWREIKTQADADNNPFNGSIPQVQVSLLGKRVAPLNSSTQEFAYDSAPVRYSTNPAEILLDYLRNPRYGKGLINSDIHWDSWIKSANKCNTTVTYVTGQTYAGPILTSNFVLDTGQTIMNNVKTLLMGFRGYMPYVQGKYKLRIEDAGNELDILSGVAQVVMTATTKPYPKNQFVGNVTDIVGDITYTGVDKSNKYTSVVVNYVDPDQKWSPQQVVWPETEVERQTYIVKDGGRENKQEVTFPTITNYAIAKDMAKLLFLKSRRQETLSITVTSEGMELEPGDNIRVEGNILNFNTGNLIVPWRVVSVKLNDNMTVALGLVKNPDDIYPHARYNEEDTVDAVYVPKGSDIYYPGSTNRGDPVGLVPPNQAPFPPVIPPNLPPQVPPPPYVPPQIYVPPDTPNPITPTPPANPNPTPVPPPAPFAAYLTLKSSRATLITSNTYSYSLVFTQPSDGLYSYSIFYWRLNAYSAWQEIRLATIPGAGGDIPVSFVCTFGLFDFYVRSYATDGRASNRVVQGQIVFRQNTAEQYGLNDIATARVQTVTEGWTLPASTIDPNPRYNDYIYDFAILPQTSGGLPLARRKVSVRFTQLVDTINQTPNNLIKGVRIYYKNSADTYYAFEDKFFDDITGYSPYNQTEYNLNGDFGARNTGDALAGYDFVAKLLYKDGGNATKYLAPGRGNVERSGQGLTSGFIIYGTSPYGNASVRYLDIPAGWTIRTVDQAPQGPKAGSEIVPSIKSIRPLSYTENKISWSFEPPQSTKFMGFKIRFREVVPGTDPGFTTVEVGASVRESQDIFYQMIDGGFRLNTFFDWVITAQYWDPITATTLESDNSLICQANVPVNVGLVYTELMNNIFNFRQENTKTALNALDAPFAAIPTPLPKTWIKRQVKQYDLYGALGSGGTQIVASSARQVEAYALKTSNVVTAIRLGCYYKLTFTTPNDTFDNITVWRRLYNQTAAQGTGTRAKYLGLGAWEKIEIPRASLGAKVNGVYTLNLRGPLHPNLFDGNYQQPGYASATLFQSYYGPNGNWPNTGTSVVNSVYPYWGAGNTNFSVITNTTWVEFLLAIKDVGVLSTDALRLTDFNTSGDGPNYRLDSNGFAANVSNQNVVPLANYNNFVPGYKRNLNEAIDNVPLNKLVLPDSPNQWNLGGTPYRVGALSSSWINLSGPEGTDTVY